MDSSSTRKQGLRPRKETAPSSEDRARNSGGVVDAPQQGQAPESAPGPTSPAQPEAPVVLADGQPVTEFRALIDGQAGALVTQDQVVVFNRVYYVGGKFDLGNGSGTKIAGETVLSVVYDPALNLRIETTNYVAIVPAHSVKASWRKA